jgi:hypothetical protein
MKARGMCLGLVIPAIDYYAVTLTADASGKTERTVFSHFVGWGDETTRIELRAASVVHAERMAESWCALGQSCVVVNSERELQVFVALLGGHALIAHEVVEEHVPEVLAGSPCVKLGVTKGFSGVKAELQQARRRHPAPRDRMTIMRRDEYRCRLCGRRPDDSLDLRLHVHHINDYAKGGPTLPWNLITLCQTCHDGVEEVDQSRLYDSLGEFDVDVLEHTRSYLEGVARYRRARQTRFQKRS